MHVWVILSARVQVVDQLVVFFMESKSHRDVILQRLVREVKQNCTNVGI